MYCIIQHTNDTFTQIYSSDDKPVTEFIAKFSEFFI